MQDALRDLEVSRSKYADLYEHAPTGYCTVNSTGVVLEMNLTFARMLSLSRKQLESHPFANLLLGQFVEPFYRHLMLCQETPRQQTLEVVLRTGPSPVHLVVQLVFQRAGAGSERPIYINVVDISKQAQLTRNMKFLAAVGIWFAESLDSLMLLDDVARRAVPFLADVTSVRATGQKCTDGVGVRPATCCDPTRPKLAGLLGTDWFADIIFTLHEDAEQSISLEDTNVVLLSTEDQAESYKPAKRAALTALRDIGVKFVVIAALRVRKRTIGSLVFLQMRTPFGRPALDLPLIEEYGRRAAIALAHCLMLEARHHEVQARSNLLAVVSHDLRNPLSSITLRSSSLARLTVGDVDKTKKGAEIILRNAKRMEELISDLLDVASIESGTFALLANPFSLQSAIAEAVESSQLLGAEKNLNILSSGESDLVVCTDRRRTLQVLSNLLGNAIKFSPPGTTISVSARPAGRHAVVEVGDQGDGLSAEQCANVFNRFWQAKKTGKSGVGLGLTICRGIVEAAGGTIEVHSEPGSGCCFSFTLPLANEGNA